MDQNSDIWGNRYLTLNRIWSLNVGAVAETTAIGEVDVLRDTIDEYFPLGVEVCDIDIEEKTGSYKETSIRTCEFHLEEEAGQHTDFFG